MKKNVQKNIPLDQQQATILNSKTDKLEKRSVLHADLCQQYVSGVLYKSIQLNSGTAEEEYLDMLNTISADLQWMHSLDHAKFWCQVINDVGIHACLDSYLRHAPRYKQTSWPIGLTEKHNLVHKLVFLTFLRMSTPKESVDCFLSKDVFAEILYNNFLFDIPRMMDICSLYGVPYNQPLLNKMLDSIFQNQPHYFDDLKQAAKTVIEILQQIESKCSTVSSEVPCKLAGGPPVSPLLEMSEAELKDVVLYLSDTMHTLKKFVVDVFPTGSAAFYETGILEKLSMIYGGSLVQLSSALRDQKYLLDLSQYHELQAYVRQSCDSLLSIVYTLVKTHALDPIFDAVKSDDYELAEVLADEYFHVMSSLLSDQKFIRELNEKFNVRKDVEAVLQACPNVSHTQYSFIINAFGEARASSTGKTPGIQTTNLTSNDLSCSTFDHNSASSSRSVQTTILNDSTAEASEDVETASLISSIQDLLPNLGNGFVNACLREYDFNPERVIQKLLDDDLPDHLRKIDRLSSETPENILIPNSLAGTSNNSATEQPCTSRQGDYLSERRNIYDNDEFDVFGESHNVDLSKIHRGKQNKSNVDHWKGDAEVDIAKLQSLYSKYGLVEEGIEDEFEFRVSKPTNYEDEYDDTYDDVAVIANDADSADELLPGQTLKEGNSQTHEGKPNRRDFCENPETIRARNEARWQQRREDAPRRGGRSSRAPKPHSNASAGQRPKHVDRKKEAHKHSRGGQNRRVMASRKASRGMGMAPP